MATKSKTHFFLTPGNQRIILMGIIFGVILAFALTPYMFLVIDLGEKISQPYMMTDYITALVWAGVLGFSIVFWPVSNEDKTRLLWAWFLKCFVCLFVLLYYEYSYHSDSQGYYVVAKMERYYIKDMIERNIFTVFTDAGVRADRVTILVYYYNRLVPIFLSESYHSLKLTFSMLGFISLYLIFRASVIFTQKKNWTFFWFLFLFPSLLIYGSRIGKEVIVLLGISLFVLGVVGWHCKGKVGYIFLGLLGVFSFSYIRPWLAGIFAPSFIVFFFLSNKRVHGATGKIIRLLFGSLFLLGCYNFVLHKLKIASLQAAFEKMEFHREHFVGGGSSMAGEVPQLSGIGDLIMEAPTAIFTGLFRPLPFDVHSTIGFLSGLEGLLLVFLAFRAIIRTPIKELNEPLVAWALIIVLCWATIYGYVTQNFGTLVRWKTQIIPIFLGLLLYLGRSRSEDLKPSGSQALNPPTLKI